jgi:hypothetical protein
MLVLVRVQVQQRAKLIRRRCLQWHWPTKASKLACKPVSKLAASLAKKPWSAHGTFEHQLLCKCWAPPQRRTTRLYGTHRPVLPVLTKCSHLFLLFVCMKMGPTHQYKAHYENVLAGAGY